MYRRKFINLAPQLTAVIAAPSFWGRAYAEDGVSDKNITIGSSAGLTGPLVNFAVGLQLGAKAAMQRINSKGGINGRQLQLQLPDDGYVATRTAENVKKMLADNSVFALMSCMGTANNTAILPMIEAANVPYVAPYTGAASLRKNTLRNVFHVRASYADECTRLVSRIVDMGITSLAIAYADNPFGKELLGDMQKTLASKNVKAVAEVAVAVDGKDMDEVTGKLLAAKPSAVLLCTLGANSMVLTNNLRKVSPGLPLAGISVTFTSEALSQLGDAGKGIAITTVMPNPLSGKVALASIDNFDLGGFSVGYSSAPYVGSKFVDLGILNNAGRVIT